MPVRNTVCPYCGVEALANVPDKDTKILGVKKNNGSADPDTYSACAECGKEFRVWYEGSRSSMP